MKIGDKIWLEPQGNAKRYSEKLIETTITKIGRKYFEVQGHYGRFFIETMMQDGKGYVSDYRAYLTETGLLEKVEKQNLYYNISKSLNSLYNSTLTLTLDQLRKIQYILDEKTTK